MPGQGNWRVFYLGFSRSGWTKAALEYQKAIQRQHLSGKNWQVVGMRLVDLQQVDQDLEQWSMYVEPDLGEIKF